MVLVTVFLFFVDDTEDEEPTNVISSFISSSKTASVDTSDGLYTLPDHCEKCIFCQIHYVKLEDEQSKCKARIRASIAG